jgi:hypothetical protein
MYVASVVVILKTYERYKTYLNGNRPEGLICQRKRRQSKEEEEMMR